MDNKVEAIVRTAGKLEFEGLLADADVIAVRDGDGFLFAKGLKGLDGGSVVRLAADAVNEDTALIKAVFAAVADANAVIVNSAPYCMAVSANARRIPAVLDDMAQIIGPSAKVSGSAGINDILRTLKGRHACLIKDKGVIAVGRTLDEAFVGSLVLEKGAKTYIESAALGGARPINIFEAALMHFIYKKKYSKIQMDREAGL